MIKLLVAFLASFVLSLILMPLIIRFFKKKKAQQTILGYVENHKDKNGTTTMGGVVFIISTLLLAFVFIEYDTVWFMCLLVSVFYGILGFLDDYIKVKHKQNLGLRAYQKIVGQAGIAIIFSIFIYFSSQAGNMFVPFSSDSFDIKYFIIPVVIVVMIASTNSVNLLDGLDGLAGSISLIYLIIFTVISSIVGIDLYNQGETGTIITNISNINILSMLFIGAILGFLIFNTSKASIFMGDVGSLCLGGYIGSSACILGLELILPILGICFVISALSVILQVAVFKMKRKRIFKMAPFHHHLQLSGLSEPKIVIIYSSITLAIGVLSIIFYLL